MIWVVWLDQLGRLQELLFHIYYYLFMGYTLRNIVNLVGGISMCCLNIAVFCHRTTRGRFASSGWIQAPQTLYFSRDQQLFLHQVEPPNSWKSYHTHPFLEIREICRVYYHHYHGMCAIFNYIYMYIYISMNVHLFTPDWTRIRFEASNPVHV